MISRIEHRTNPLVLQDQELLPSQRSLLEIPDRNSERPYFEYIFSDDTKVRLGEMLTDAMQLPAETIPTSGRDADFYAKMQRNMADFAKQLLQHGLPYARREPRGSDGSAYVQADVLVLSDYSSMLFEGPQGYHYTPEGDVIDPQGELRQKLVFFRMRGKQGYIGGSDDASFALYTNNLIAQPPRWEYNDHNGSVTDILPHSAYYPHRLNARPELIPNERIAGEIIRHLPLLLDQPVSV
ncbi:MAG: hypothetical protein WAQ27_03995 [Candidatus Microsaccharimonas sp.]